MGYIGSCFEKLEGWAGSFTVEVFGSILKREWIEEALRGSDRDTQRERKLPAPVTLWLVIGMALYRNLSIKNILHRMGNVMGVGSLWENGAVPASSSEIEARDRLGWGPLRWLVEKLREWILGTYREEMSWKGLLLLALDGTTLKVPDSAENRRRFGLPGASRGRAAFPQMRALFLVSTKLRFILGARFAPYGRGEIPLAMRMIASIPRQALVIVDRYYNAWEFLLGLRVSGHEFLVRVRKGMRGKTVAVLGQSDRWVEVKVPRALRHRRSDLPKRVLVREITARIGGRWFRYWTSLTDASVYPAREMVLRYQERWQEEIGLDEIKTHQCGATTVNRPVIFRCMRTRRVLQEAYGLVLAYNLIRCVMTEAAIKAGVCPLRISFIDSVERIRSTALLMAAAPTPMLPAIFADLIKSIGRCRLPIRRRKNPRVVCVKMSAYKLKAKPKFRRRTA
jgi:hypothetical protein